MLSLHAAERERVRSANADSDLGAVGLGDQEGGAARGGGGDGGVEEADAFASATAGGGAGAICGRVGPKHERMWHSFFWAKFVLVMAPAFAALYIALRFILIVHTVLGTSYIHETVAASPVG